jgi:hypothetical protein
MLLYHHPLLLANLVYQNKQLACYEDERVTYTEWDLFISARMGEEPPNYGEPAFKKPLTLFW